MVSWVRGSFPVEASRRILELDENIKLKATINQHIPFSVWNKSDIGVASKLSDSDMRRRCLFSPSGCGRRKHGHVSIWCAEATNPGVRMQVWKNSPKQKMEILNSIH